MHEQLAKTRESSGGYKAYAWQQILPTSEILFVSPQAEIAQLITLLINSYSSHRPGDSKNHLFGLLQIPSSSANLLLRDPTIMNLGWTAALIKWSVGSLWDLRLWDVRKEAAFKNHSSNSLTMLPPPSLLLCKVEIFILSAEVLHGCFSLGESSSFA